MCTCWVLDGFLLPPCGGQDDGYCLKLFRCVLAGCICLLTTLVYHRQGEILFQFQNLSIFFEVAGSRIVVFVAPPAGGDRGWFALIYCFEVAGTKRATVYALERDRLHPIRHVIERGKISTKGADLVFIWD